MIRLPGALELLLRPRKASANFVQTIDGVVHVGWVDGVRNDRLSGWVCQQSSPTRLAVIVETAQRSFRTLADLYRADVQRLGHSATGYCGFSIPVTRPGDDPLRVFVERPHFELGGSPVVEQRIATAKPARKRSKFGDIIVAVDDDRMRLSGWACYTQAPARRPLLLLEHDGVTLERCRATLFRPDAEALLGDGWHGFSFALPQRPGCYRLRDAENAIEFHQRRCKAA